jgi:hypothetical protein
MDGFRDINVDWMVVVNTQARCEGCRCVAGGEQSEAGSVEPVECKVGLYSQ